MPAASGLVGARELAALLRRQPRLAERGLAFGLRAEGESIMGVSKRERVPVDTGALRASGYVEAPITVGSDVIVVLGFGGSAEPYALVQHEEESYRHTVGEHHYLSKPVNEAAAGFERRLAAHVARFVL